MHALTKKDVLSWRRRPVCTAPYLIDDEVRGEAEGCEKIKNGNPSRVEQRHSQHLWDVCQRVESVNMLEVSIS